MATPGLRVAGRALLDVFVVSRRVRRRIHEWRREPQVEGMGEQGLTQSEKVLIIER